ncbi:unnamed protein product [Acanthoscelides obtectus]|uniref:Uncharacterized protein n=1 Tax=Acanthoscelides obtectus TaxID=200917 RepID=A0A9P0JS19_ACAOB|nr:unnamed protein product [Acanthoscelides obtectus]CAK1668102.1 hypothetical protein AOBTE_LOCUS26224 [Acanthoscelides obtectus]
MLRKNIPLTLPQMKHILGERTFLFDNARALPVTEVAVDCALLRANLVAVGYPVKMLHGKAVWLSLDIQLCLTAPRHW